VERGIPPAILFSAKNFSAANGAREPHRPFPRASGDAAQNVHGRFLRSEDFLLQNCATLRNAARMLNRETPSIRNRVQRRENTRKNSFLNYETVALPAELHRRGAGKDGIPRLRGQAGSC